MTSTEPHDLTAPDAEAPGSDTGLMTRRAWHVALIQGAVAYLVSRLFVLLGAGIVAADRAVDSTAEGGERPTSAVAGVTEVLTSWDGKWYLEIIRGWYPRSVPPDITYEQVEARVAFFPGYPSLVRVVDRVLPGGDTFAALALNVVLGALFVLLVGLMARDLFGEATAGRAMVLTAFFPGSFVLSFAYSEALFLSLAAGCLWSLHRRWWWAAGLLAALGTATRPNGVALVVACAVAAALAIRSRRDWWSLVAPVLAPIGFIAFQLAIDAHTGERRVWFRVQREAWDEGTSFGKTALTSTWKFFQSPFSSPSALLTTASLFGLAAMAFAAWKRRLPWSFLAYSAVVIALMVIPATVTARPRFVYTAFPLVIALAALFEPSLAGRWHRWRTDAWALVLAVCGAGLVTVTALYGVFASIP